MSPSAPMVYSEDIALRGLNDSCTLFFTLSLFHIFTTTPETFNLTPH